MLDLRNVSKRFGGLTAIDDLNFRVTEGAIHAIVGPNGAGKTTLFNLITGHLTLSTGEIRFEGRNITGLRPESIARLGISRTFQLTSVFPRISVRENIWLGANANWNTQRQLHSGRNNGADQRAQAMIDRLGLADIADATASELSYGQQRMLDIAIALSTTPRLLLLDEPTAGLSGSETQTMTSFIRSLIGETSVVLIEHDMDVVAELATVTTVLHNGRILAEGTIDALVNSPEVRNVYLGESSTVLRAHDRGAI